jgi:hypothetical protein
MSPLLLAVILGFLFIQNTVAGVKIGVRAGVNIATFSSSSRYFSPGTELSSYLGPAVGGILEMDFSGPLFFRIEPMYIQKGVSTSYTYLGTETKRGFKLDFVQAPMLVGLQVPLGGVIPYIFVGPNLGVMLTEGYNRTDFAIDAGLGLGFEISTAVTLLLDVRYSTGLTNLGTEGAIIETRGLQPLLGATFAM